MSRRHPRPRLASAAPCAVPYNRSAHRLNASDRRHDGLTVTPAVEEVEQAPSSQANRGSNRDDGRDVHGTLRNMRGAVPERPRAWLKRRLWTEKVHHSTLASRFRAQASVECLGEVQLYPLPLPDRRRTLDHLSLDPTYDRTIRVRTVLVTCRVRPGNLRRAAGRRPMRLRGGLIVVRQAYWHLEATCRSARTTA
jgi:hypothetical protein